MSTKQPRLNVVLEPKLYSTVKKLAAFNGLSLSMEARNLIQEAIEIEDDNHWQLKAQNRDDSFNPSEALSHDEAWG